MISNEFGLNLETVFSYSNKLECLPLASLLQPSLVFVGKAGPYTVEEPFRFSTLG
jgi:hypothetical protein